MSKCSTWNICKKTHIATQNNYDNNNNIIVPTHKIVHAFLDVLTVTEVKLPPKSVYKKNQAHKYFHRNTIFLTESDYDFIPDEIKRRETF